MYILYLLSFNVYNLQTIVKCLTILLKKLFSPHFNSALYFLLKDFLPYIKSRVVGPVWLLDPDNVGHLYTDLLAPQSALSISLLTGKDVLWIYPDLTTALK